MEVLRVPSETKSSKSSRTNRGRIERKSHSRSWRSERDSSSASGSRKRRADLFTKPEEVKQKREDPNRRSERRIINQEEDNQKDAIIK